MLPSTQKNGKSYSKLLMHVVYWIICVKYVNGETFVISWMDDVCYDVSQSCMQANSTQMSCLL